MDGECRRRELATFRAVARGAARCRPSTHALLATPRRRRRRPHGRAADGRRNDRSLAPRRMQPRSSLVGSIPDDRRGVLAAARTAQRADRAARGPRACRELSLHAHRRRAARRARARPGDVSQHRRRPRPERVHVHRARHRVDGVGFRLRDHRRDRRAQGPLHGGAPGPALDMVFEIGEASRAEEVLRQKIESGRAADGLRPSRLQSARSARRRPRRGRGADVHARRRHGAVRAGARPSSRPRCGCSRSTSRDASCRRTSSSTRRCCCTGSVSKCRCSRRRSRSAAWRAGSRTVSSSGARTGSSGRPRCTGEFAIDAGEAASFEPQRKPAAKKHVSNPRRITSCSRWWRSSLW